MDRPQRFLTHAVVLSGLFVGFGSFLANGFSAMHQQKIERAKFIESIDTFYLRHFGAGNLFIRFAGFDAERHGSVVFELYFRACYRLYPRRVFVAPGNGSFKRNA